MKQRATIIVQVRIGSKRFPGKALYKFKGKAALTHLIEGLLSEFTKNEILVATSFEAQDTPIEELCSQLAIPCYRGPEENVAFRFVGACELVLTPYIVRLCADSPLLPPKIVRAATDLAIEKEADLVTTTLEPKFPSGFNVEVLNREVFLKHYPKFNNEDLEHITRYFYTNSHSFKIIGMPCSIQDPEQYKFSFDTQEDCQRIERIFAELTAPHFEYSIEEKCQIYRRLFGDAS